MTFIIFSIAIAVFLFGVVVVVLAIVIAGIRSDERARNLASTPRTRAEAVTRRLLGVGVRSTNARSETRDDHA